MSDKIGTRGTHADELRGRLATAVTAPFRPLFGMNGRAFFLKPEPFVRMMKLGSHTVFC